MTLEFGIWRIDNGLEALDFSPLEIEAHLEDILDQDITIAAPNWMVIGRQVPTSYGKFIDLLAIDADGNPVVLELKRDATYRDIVAQVLDYGSWVKELRTEHLAQIFDEYLKKRHPERAGESLDQAFCARFKVKEMPEDLNTSHQLVIVASSLDPSTERVVKYLYDTYGVEINAVFFRAFKDGEADLLVATTVIEVGVDVPNATVMVILDADRFGIAQLHQLRGRVGRGSAASTCWLVAAGTTPDGEARLEAMVRTTDGFELAEVDLDLRGEGTLMGGRQKGRSDLKLASLRRDRETVGVAREVAIGLVDADPDLADAPLLVDEVRLFLGDDEQDFLLKG